MKRKTLSNVGHTHKLTENLSSTGILCNKIQPLSSVHYLHKRKGGERKCLYKRMGKEREGSKREREKEVQRGERQRESDVHVHEELHVTMYDYCSHKSRIGTAHKVCDCVCEREGIQSNNTRHSRHIRTGPNGMLSLVQSVKINSSPWPE